MPTRIRHRGASRIGGDRQKAQICLLLFRPICGTHPNRKWCLLRHSCDVTMALMNARLLESTVQEIVGSFPAISLVYLFGSRVEGKLGPMSDYDFAILMDHGTTNGEMQAQLTHVLGLQVGVARVDVVLLNQATIELAYAVIAQGQLLYQRDVATRVEYEAQVMSLYGDYLPVLRAQRAELLKRENHDARIQRYRAAFGRTERTLSQIVPTA